jgi:hypothetical protein
MSTPRRATPEQWASQKAWAVDDDDSACLIDLHARVEALEADQLEQAESHRFCVDAIVRRVEALEAAYEETAMTELRAASAQPAGGLVERVAARIEYGIDAELDPEGIARAAIRDVAAAAKERIAPFNPWLRWNDVAQWLEQEASQ